MSERVFGCALAAVLALTAAPVRAAAGPSSFSFSGRGHGHGRGMGQWGAKAIAERGRAYETILSFYYQGVSYARLERDPAIRVHVGTVAAARISASGPFDVYEVGGRAIAQGARGVFRVRPDHDGVIVEKAADHDGPWSVVRRSARNIAFAPRKAMLGVVDGAGGARYYRGSITVHRVSAGTVWIIVTTSVQKYLRGVVPREMPSDWPAHALKAQAVAARTYAIRAARRARDRGLAYDICSSTTCQVFGGAARRAKAGAGIQRLETPETDAAVSETGLTIMTYRGEPISAVYSSSTGGYTAPGGAPYLRPRSDSNDAGAPHHTWIADVAATRIEAAYPSLGDLLDVRVTKRDGYGPGGGRATEVLLDGARADARVSGTTLRRAAGLRSAWFSV